MLVRKKILIRLAVHALKVTNQLVNWTRGVNFSAHVKSMVSRPMARQDVQFE